MPGLVAFRLVVLQPCSLCPYRPHVSLRREHDPIPARHAADLHRAKRVRGRPLWMAGADGVPVEWLDGTPFDDYFVPSLILFAIVGGTSLVGAVAVFTNTEAARRAALGAARS